MISLSETRAHYVRIRWRPEMRRRPDMTESPSTSSGGQSSALCPDGLPVCREILCPQYNLHVYRSIYIPTGYEPGLNALPIRYPSIIAPAALCLASASHPCTLVFFLSRNFLEPRRVRRHRQPDNASRLQSPAFTMPASIAH